MLGIPTSTSSQVDSVFVGGKAGFFLCVFEKLKGRKLKLFSKLKAKNSRSFPKLKVLEVSDQIFKETQGFHAYFSNLNILEDITDIIRNKVSKVSADRYSPN